MATTLQQMLNSISAKVQYKPHQALEIKEI